MKTSDKRDRIIQTSLELIAEHGFHGVPMSLIAENAGVGAGTIYRYFESKDVLIMALFHELEGKIVSAITEGYSEEMPVRERFLYLCAKLVTYFVEHPLHFRFMEQHFNSPYGVSLRKDRFLGKASGRDPFMDLFEQGIVQKELKDLPILVHAALTFSPLAALARDHTLDLIKLDKALMMKSIEACWDGIKR